MTKPTIKLEFLVGGGWMQSSEYRISGGPHHGALIELFPLLSASWDWCEVWGHPDWGQAVRPFWRTRWFDAPAVVDPDTISVVESRLRAMSNGGAK